MRLKKPFISFCLTLARIALGVTLAGCATDHAQVSQPAKVVDSENDPLYVADKVDVTFSETPEPITPNNLVQTEIKGDGTINLPDIGPVPAAGKTPGELEKIIQEKYVPAYYKHLTVTVTPSMRFFYVGGQVNGGNTSGQGGGRYPYSGPITVTQAIYSAGDFTPFADKKHVRLTRRKDHNVITINCVQALKHPEKDIPVYPGDRIDVPRRWW